MTLGPSIAASALDWHTSKPDDISRPRVGCNVRSSNTLPQWCHQVLCASHMLGGQRAEARCSLAELRYWYPYLTIERVTAGLGVGFPRVCCENVADGLEAAGLPR